jgi:hypothetical protein
MPFMPDETAPANKTYTMVAGALMVVLLAFGVLNLLGIVR